MKRTLSITVAVVSALLAVGVCCVWVRSYWFTDQLSWSACRDETMQVSQRFPRIGQYIKAPCWVRAQGGVKPHCPEGDRFCGVPVWKLPLESYARLI